MKNKILMSAVVMGILSMGAVAQANEYEAKAKALADGKIKAWLANPAVINAVKAQNTKNASLTPADIATLDKKWAAGDKSVVDPALNNTLSDYLKKIVKDGGGLYTEIFVMDNKGLNVGQSDKTSDLWQGDEAKWQKTYPAGPSAIHLSDVEMDESSQAFQMQISIPVVDGGANIGAVTVGVNADKL
jgi:hypothetical protein